MAPEKSLVSFRDPAGSLAILDDRVLRCVHEEALLDLEAFLASPVAAEAEASGRIVGTRPATVDAATIAKTGWDATGSFFEHDRIPFASYPYEWPPGMLAAAAHATLDLHEALLSQGMGLKDATPYNILFSGPRPVFIDLLSIERRDPHDPIWNAYGQFIRTFLLPLLVQRDHKLRPADLLLARRDGLEPEVVYAMVPRLRRLRVPYFGLVTLPTWLAGRARKRPDIVYAPKRVRDPREATFVVGAAVRRLRRHLRRVTPSGRSRSHWSQYMQTRGHYDPAAADDKERFVHDALTRCAPEWVLDAGCNTGHFSRLAAHQGARVVAIDSDPVSADHAWRAAEEEGLDILPLVVDLARPSPAVGWDNQESASFLDRARGRFDMVLMLAVMHHLHVTERIPIDRIVDLAAELTRGHVVFEYVGPQDEKFRELVRGRQALHAGLSRDTFEAAAKRRFEIVAAKALPGCDRVLYLLRGLGA